MTKVKPITFKLDEPIEIGEGDDAQTFDQLIFKRKMKGKDLLAMDAVTGQVRKGFALYANMASVPMAVMEEMAADDYERLVVEVVPLMGKRGQAMLAAIEADEEETPSV